MTTKWNVQIGSIREEISADLLGLLGFECPYSDDETNTARSPFTRYSDRLLTEAYAIGLRGDEAALEAIRLMESRRAAQAIETARQKVAEIELRAASERRAAEGIAFARYKAMQKD
jgi:hypothetical protein